MPLERREKPEQPGAGQIMEENSFHAWRMDENLIWGIEHENK